ncbi:hypothetical protein YWIDRAFT_07948 [Streptomyces sp. SceaMP-e96]|nr:hypothetical protein YWIDRAFT_07948 [Streptomyces sp. SceaMP-e96]
MPVLVLGSVLTVAMALIVDWLGTLVELLLRPRGLEVDCCAWPGYGRPSRARAPCCSPPQG